MTTRPEVRLGLALALAASAAWPQGSDPNISGTVKSVGGVPVAGLEVKVEGTQMVTRTDTRGAFAFVNAPKGSQEISVRGIGFLPARVPTMVPERSVAMEITILSAPAHLDTVQVRERVNVLSGIVVDEMNRPVPGATIEVITGDRKTLTSGEDGWFTLTSVREGVTVFRTTKEGFFMTNTSVRMSEWRGIVIRLETLDSRMRATAAADASGTSNNAAAAWRDTGIRLSMRGSRAVILSQEELAPFAHLPMTEAVVQTKAGQALGIELERHKGNICVLIDGRRPVGSTSLDTWRGGDVDMIELYPPGTESSGTSARYMRGAGCRTRVDAGRTRGPFFAVLWLK
jgi:hypothetical protein